MKYKTKMCYPQLNESEMDIKMYMTFPIRSTKVNETVWFAVSDIANILNLITYRSILAENIPSAHIRIVNLCKLDSHQHKTYIRFGLVDLQAIEILCRKSRCMYSSQFYDWMRSTFNH